MLSIDEHLVPQAAWETVFTYLEGLPLEALQDVAQAEKWTAYVPINQEGACCLTGHADGVYYATSDHQSRARVKQKRRTVKSVHTVTLDDTLFVHNAFDHLCRTLDLNTVVAAVQEHARTLLAQRTLDSPEA
jgi:hypothetical protein